MRLRLTLVALIAIASIGIGCATFQNHYHNPDGSLNVAAILQDGRWGVDESCDQEWLPVDACTLAHDSLNTADAIVAKNLPGAAAAVRTLFADIDAKLPVDSRLHPYLRAIEFLLPAS